MLTKLLEQSAPPKHNIWQDLSYISEQRLSHRIWCEFLVLVWWGIGTPGGMPWEGEWLEYAKCSKSISCNFYTHWYFRNGPDLSLTALELLMCTTPTCGLKHNSRCRKGCGRSMFSNRLFSDSPVSFVKFFEGGLFELVVCSITPTFLRDCSLTSMSVPVSMLLNTDLPVEPELPNTIDVWHLITSVSELLSCPSLRAPPHIAEHLLDVVNYFSSDDYPIERSTHTQMDIPPPPSTRPLRKQRLTFKYTIQHQTQP